MRANQDKIGMPGYGRFDDGLSSVPYFNSSPYTEPRSTQLIRDSLQQYKSQLLLIFQAPLEYHTALQSMRQPSTRHSIAILEIFMSSEGLTSFQLRLYR